jgi:hypothetical protein
MRMGQNGRIGMCRPPATLSGADGCIAAWVSLGFLENPEEGFIFRLLREYLIPLPPRFMK